MEDRAHEQGAYFAGKAPVSTKGGAKSGAVDARNGEFDADLGVVIHAWPDLSADVRAGILAMIRTALP